jgi:hypothetical protein
LEGAPFLLAEMDEPLKIMVPSPLSPALPTVYWLNGKLVPVVTADVMYCGSSGSSGP